MVHKVCKILNIKSKAKHYKYKRPGEESVKYSNVINGNWNTSRPFEKIVSDTTTFYFKKKKYDWTFYLDVFNEKTFLKKKQKETKNDDDKNKKNNYSSSC